MVEWFGGAQAHCFYLLRVEGRGGYAIESQASRFMRSIYNLQADERRGNSVSVGIEKGGKIYGKYTSKEKSKYISKYTILQISNTCAKIATEIQNQNRANVQCSATRSWTWSMPVSSVRFPLGHFHSSTSKCFCHLAVLRFPHTKNYSRMKIEKHVRVSRGKPNTRVRQHCHSFIHRVHLFIQNSHKRLSIF